LRAARLAEAEREANRAKVIFDQGAMPQSTFDQAQTGRDIAAAQADQAKAALRMAEQALADTTITAPFSGAITGKFRNAGDTVTLMPVSPIVQLTDVDHLELRLTVPEALEPAIAPGQLIAGETTPGGRAFKAKVRVKSAVVDPTTRTVEVLADVVSADGIRPGTLVTADFGRFDDLAVGERGVVVGDLAQSRRGGVGGGSGSRHQGMRGVHRGKGSYRRGFSLQNPRDEGLALPTLARPPRRRQACPREHLLELARAPLAALRPGLRELRGLERLLEPPAELGGGVLRRVPRRRERRDALLGLRDAAAQRPEHGVHPARVDEQLRAAVELADRLDQRVLECRVEREDAQDALARDRRGERRAEREHPDQDDTGRGLQEAERAATHLVVDLEAEPSNRAHELIENLMVAANGVTARFLDEARFVKQLVAVEHALLVPGAAFDAEIQPNAVLATQRPRDLRRLGFRGHGWLGCGGKDGRLGFRGRGWLGRGGEDGRLGFRGPTASTPGRA